MVTDSVWDYHIQLCDKTGRHICWDALMNHTFNDTNPSINGIAIPKHLNWNLKLKHDASFKKYFGQPPVSQRRLKSNSVKKKVKVRVFS